MARKDKTLLYAGLAAGAGVGLYMFLKGKYYNDISKLVAYQNNLPAPSEPGFWELIFSSATTNLAKARMLDDMMKLRLPKPLHYDTWKAALIANQASYKVNNICFLTKNGAVCPL